MRLSFTLVAVCSTVILAQSPASDPARLATMQHHFAQVFVVHEALIRGDLPAIRSAAAGLSTLATPSGMPPSTAAYVTAIRLAGRQAADSSGLASAASAVSEMLAQCGQCHRAVGVPVAVSTPAGHDVGGIVGHMLDHQQAADAMLEGLIAPSPSRWQTGAERLAKASLWPHDKLPNDLELLEKARETERRLHAFAQRAAKDTNAGGRPALYAQMTTTCAECHSLHRRIWGPTRGRGPVGF